LVNIILYNIYIIKLVIAEVWMDEYKKFFYIINPGVFKTAKHYGDITDRVQLRENLECKSFQWYLDNIYPDAQIPRRLISY